MKSLRRFSPFIVLVMTTPWCKALPLAQRLSRSPLRLSHLQASSSPNNNDSDNNSDNNNNNNPEADYARLDKNGIDKSLLPPAINLRKESILFGENPATRYDSNLLRAWRATKRYLPFVLTGARTPCTADENPIGGFYNMIFVRFPVICAGLVYTKNALSGHPLVIDVGSGPTEVSPLLVATVLFVILR